MLWQDKKERTDFNAKRTEYDLSINKYKKTEYVAVEYPSTEEIMGRLQDLKTKYAEELDKLNSLLDL